jgi:PAS domain S-box-containing protein
MTPSEMIAGSAVAAVISDPNLPDTPIIECNDAFVTLTGYARDEIIGRNCRFLSGPGTEPELTEEIRTAVRERRTVLVEILNYKKGGLPFRNAVMVAPLFDADGELRYFLGSQVEIAADPVPSEPRTMPIDTLSPRQKEVLLMMVAGKLNKQIAYELGISERTVKMHRAAMFRALGCRTSADVLRVAIEGGY